MGDPAPAARTGGERAASQAVQSSQAQTSIEVWLVLGIALLVGGMVVTALGVDHLLKAVNSFDPTSFEPAPSKTGPTAATIAGLLIGAAGGFMIQVATIAKGVQLGNRSSF